MNVTALPIVSADLPDAVTLLAAEPLMSGVLQQVMQDTVLQGKLRGVLQLSINGAEQREASRTCAWSRGKPPCHTQRLQQQSAFDALGCSA